LNNWEGFILLVLLMYNYDRQYMDTYQLV